MRRLLAGAADGAGPPLTDVARALRSSRLLAAVVAVADEIDDEGGDTSSHMAVVSMVNARGEKGLLAFTGLDSLLAWDPDARPVPSLGREVARSAIDDAAQAVVIDVAGPHRVVLSGPSLDVLADNVDQEGVATAIHAALAPLTVDGRVEVTVQDPSAMEPEPGVPVTEADVLVLVRARAGEHPDGRTARQLAEKAAAILAGRADIQRRAPGGIAVTTPLADPTP